jgi:excisionase family DNA binding protein
MVDSANQPWLYLPAMDEPHDLMTTGEAANQLGVSVQTVRRWERSGALAAVRTPGNQRRFRRSDVDALLAPQQDGAA